MLKHEAKLIDPDADAIIAALTETTVAANKRCRARLLEDDPAKWKKFAKAVAAEPEGWGMFRGGRGGVPATQVLAAWWTDSADRKHVVVRGRRVEHDEAKRLLQKAELDKRSPLWHAYPEYVCRRTVGEKEEIVCACGCGAVGSPQALAWMGATCGPCFDRKEELGAAGLLANLPGVLYGDRVPLGVLVCSPDGTRVAATEGDDKVTYWDLSARTRTTMRFEGRRPADIAITSDARHLLVTGTGLVSAIGLFAVLDVTTDPPTKLETALEFDPPGWGLNPLPDPELALVCRTNEERTAVRAEVIRVPTGEVVRGAELSGVFGTFDLSPDGTRFVTRGDQPTVVDVNSLRPLVVLSYATTVSAFSHDGSRVFAQRGGLLVVYDAETGLDILPDAGRWLDKSLGPVTAIAVDPVGEFVYLGCPDGRLCAFSADTLRPLAAFVWHLGAITGLAVSADGSRLFSSGNDGCVKVWPIRDLLRDV